MYAVVRHCSHMDAASLMMVARASTNATESFDALAALSRSSAAVYSARARAGRFGTNWSGLLGPLGSQHEEA